MLTILVVDMVTLVVTGEDDAGRYGDDDDGDDDDDWCIYGDTGAPQQSRMIGSEGCPEGLSEPRMIITVMIFLH